MTTDRCASFANFRGALLADVLRPLPLERDFDLVWCYGVLHSTGDTAVAFRNVMERVTPRGYAFVMMYGPPREGRVGDYQAFAWLDAWRHRCRPLSFHQIADALQDLVGPDALLDYFDAVSPWINDTHSYDEVATWFADAGFVDIERRGDDMDHYVMARRRPR